jgi:hypothetical protein
MEESEKQRAIVGRFKGMPDTAENFEMTVCKSFAVIFLRLRRGNFPVLAFANEFLPT